MRPHLVRTYISTPFPQILAQGIFVVSMKLHTLSGGSLQLLDWNSGIAKLCKGRLEINVTAVYYNTSIDYHTCPDIDTTSNLHT